MPNLDPSLGLFWKETNLSYNRRNTVATSLVLNSGSRFLTDVSVSITSTFVPEVPYEASRLVNPVALRTAKTPEF